MKQDANTFIYLRTSTKEQEPELQKRDCLEFCNLKGLSVIEVVSEQGSAYRLEKKREKWETLIERAKEEGLNIVLWRYDRAFRNKEEFYKFMKIMFEVYHVKIYSVKEPSILLMWEMVDKINVPDPSMSELFKGLMKLVWELLIRQAGEQAQEESEKKSQRVKLAVRRENGVTLSYRGHKWGRKSLPQSTINEILKMRKQGHSLRDIADSVQYYDKNRNLKFVSLGVVHKIISVWSKDNSFVNKEFHDLNQ